MQRQWWRVLMVLAAASGPAWAAEPVPAELLKGTLDAVGGEAQLLRLFRIKERVALGDDPAKPGSVRVSVLEPPDHWWVGSKDRVKDEKEPAIFLVWAWTLRALVDPRSQLELLPDIVHEDKPAYGIRIAGSIAPPMDCYFARDSKRLVRLDWRADKHVFSDWKEADGVAYPSRCVGYKLKDNRRWYHTEIVELERLSELPAGLAR